MSARDPGEQRDRVEAIKAAASFARVAEELGVEWNRDGSGRLKTQCLWHDDADPSLKVEQDEPHARCYSRYAQLRRHRPRAARSELLVQ